MDNNNNRLKVTKDEEERMKKKFKIMFGFEPEGYTLKKTQVKKNVELLKKVKEANKIGNDKKTD